MKFIPNPERVGREPYHKVWSQFMNLPRGLVEDHGGSMFNCMSAGTTKAAGGNKCELKSGWYNVWQATLD